MEAGRVLSLASSGAMDVENRPTRVPDGRVSGAFFGCKGAWAPFHQRPMMI